MTSNDELNLPDYHFPSFGTQKFTQEEEELIRKTLEENVGSDAISFREGPSNKIIPYIEKSVIVESTNKVFGIGGWSTQYEEKNGKFTSGSSAIVRVILKDGCYREDIGYGYASGDTLANAVMKSKKIAVSDALKRTLKLFGSYLGNSFAKNL